MGPYRDLKNYRILSVLLVLALLVEVSAEVLYRTGHYNLWLYNLYTPIEFMLLVGFAVGQFRQRRVKRLLPYLAVPLMLVYAAEAIQLHGITWNLAMYNMTRSGLLTLCFLGLLVDLADRPEPSLFKHPTAWVALGVVLFFGALMPIYGLMKVALERDWALGRKLLYVNDVAVYLYYGAYAIARMQAVPKESNAEK